MSALIVRCPHYDKSFVEQSDALDKGSGTVLTQPSLEKDKFVKYLSRSLSPHERWYSTTDGLIVFWEVENGTN